MKTTSKLLFAVSAIPLIAASAMPAFAQEYSDGTTAGTPIQNSVSVTYNVAGTAQTPETSNTDEFLVDRVIDLTVAEANNTPTTVAPDQENMVTSFNVTNLSNDVLDFGLSVAQGTSDQFNYDEPVSYYIDTDNDGDYTDEAEITHIDELGQGDTVTVLVVANMPNGIVTGDELDIILTAQALTGGTVGTMGSPFTKSTSNTASVVDTIFGDGNGDIDGDKDGRFSDTDTYVVSAADLEVVKTSRIVWDPVNEEDSPMAIPGAIVEYCIAVTNAAGSATATGVSISDTLPSEVTYTTDNFVATTNNTSCTYSNTGTTGSHSAGVVSGTLSDIAADQTRTLIFQATIN